MAQISDQTKFKEKRGEGVGPKYKPWIKAREVASDGTASTFADYKHGREIQVLSQGELYHYYNLRWNNDVLDIREQFPLPLNKTLEIANILNIKHPSKDNRPVVMTTDFLVTTRSRVSGKELIAYSVKNNRAALKDKRTNEKITIERFYWASKDINHNVLYKSDINFIKVQNIMDVVRCFYICDIETKEDVVRHLIANKLLNVDLTKDYIDYKSLITMLEQKGGVFDEYLS